MDLKDIVFSLIKSEIDGEMVNIDADNFSAKNLEKIYLLGHKHDIAHILGNALKKHGFLPEKASITEKFNSEIIKAVYREAQLSETLKIIKSAFNENQIPFIPLKGSVLRNLYPEPWMRTSCDVDVLVREEDLSKAQECLEKVGFDADGNKNYHDVSLYFGMAHLELHFNILENIAKMDRVLEKVWDNVEKTEEYEYRQTEEFFAFHHVAHMAYHVTSGGCGIKPFIDLYLMKKNGRIDKTKLKPFLEQAGLFKFYEKALDLLDVWFNGKERTEVLKTFETFVIKGGVYGSIKNKITVGVVANDRKKLRYILNSAFPPFYEMSVMYPKLKNHKILLPFFYLYRIFSKVFGKERKRVTEKIIYAVGYSGKDVRGTEYLLNELGLSQTIE